MGDTSKMRKMKRKKKRRGKREMPKKVKISTPKMGTTTQEEFSFTQEHISMN